MRARNLKPGFFKNETLAELNPLARILFEGLWCLADREGRLEDRPKRIKVDVLPYDNCDVDAFLLDLHNNNFIFRYEVNGIQYIQIINFRKHQNPHVKEPPSTIPAPDLHHTITVQIPDKYGSDPADSLFLDSGFPITDSINPPLPSLQEGDNEPDEPGEQRKRAKTPSQQEMFDRFWQAYPKKRSKGQAEKTWAKIKPSEQLLAVILDALERAKTSIDWTKEGGNFIPHPSTWLNAKGWEDEYTQPREPTRLPRAFASIQEAVERMNRQDEN